MTTTDTTRLRELIDSARTSHYLPPLDDAIDLDELTARYVLLERGHYGQTWASDHDSPAHAARYTLHQENAEDWSAEALIDTETGETLEPATITWRTTPAGE